MTTQPDAPAPDDDSDQDPPGAEIGISEGEGSTFEPEEDPEGQG